MPFEIQLKTTTLDKESIHSRNHDTYERFRAGKITAEQREIEDAETYGNVADFNDTINGMKEGRKRFQEHVKDIIKAERKKHGNDACL